MFINTGKYTDKTEGKILSILLIAGMSEEKDEEGKVGLISLFLFMYFYIALFFMIKVYYRSFFL